MRSLSLKLLAAAAGVLAAAQLRQPDRTNPPHDPALSFEAAAKPSFVVASSVKRACYDCHSNETVWPWYSQVAPVSWLLAYDVKEGREELNFSTWQRYEAKTQRKKLRETVETLNEGEMPPWYYRLVHAPARVSDADRQAIIAWASQGTLEPRRGGP